MSIATFFRKLLAHQVDPVPPVFSFCESVVATGSSPWHIRKLTGVGRKLGGGIDTHSLCGYIRSGWDLGTTITPHHLQHCCKECRTSYVWQTAGKR